MYLSILLLPLIGGLFGTNRYVGRKLGPILSVFCLFLAVLCLIGIFFEVGLNNSPVYLNLGTWLDYGYISISWNFLFDTLTVSMYLPIVFISFLIQIYSLEYKGHDPHISRFFSLLSLFSFTMLILVSTDNLFLLLLGWEGVGLVSYLLVNFWYTRIAANKAAKTALFLNKIGDLFFIFAIVFSIGLFSDLSLSTIFSLVPHLNGDLIFILTICFIVAASAKSALIPLNSWLPLAMEGPTSVSALLHSSTMVTAGVFLLKKISPLLEFSSTSLQIIIWLGSLGAFLGACAGLIDNDIKKVIAMSTLSQLGYMIVAVGISKYNLALFHLFTHAFFKSLLFLASGAILHSVLDNQDIRKKGSLSLFLPITYLVFFFGSLSLMAFPFTSGWYSKDLLIELLIVPNNFTYTIAYIFTLKAAFLTSTYSIRLLKIVMLSRPNFAKSMLPLVKDSTYIMNTPLIILSFGAIFLGYLTNELFLANGSTFYLNSIFIHPFNFNSLFDASFYGSKLALLPLLFLLLISLILFITPFNNNNTVLNNSTFNNNISIYHNNPNYTHHQFTNFFYFLNHIMTFIYWIKHKTFIFSNYIYRYLDKGFLEFFGPLGGFKFFNFIGFYIELFSTGFIPHYALIKIISLFTIIKNILFIKLNIIIILLLLLSFIL